MLRKKPGHGRRHADNDDDDVPILSPLVSATLTTPNDPPTQSCPTPQTRNSHYFLLLIPLLPLLLVRASSSYLSSSSSISSFLSFCFFYRTLASFSASLLLIPLPFPPPWVSQCSIEYLAGRTSCSWLVERRRFKRESHRDRVSTRAT